MRIGTLCPIRRSNESKSKRSKMVRPYKIVYRPSLCKKGHKKKIDISHCECENLNVCWLSNKKGVGHWNRQHKIPALRRVRVLNRISKESEAHGPRKNIRLCIILKYGQTQCNRHCEPLSETRCIVLICCCCACYCLPRIHFFFCVPSSSHSHFGIIFCFFLLMPIIPVLFIFKCATLSDFAFKGLLYIP